MFIKSRRPCFQPQFSAQRLQCPFLGLATSPTAWPHPASHRHLLQWLGPHTALTSFSRALSGGRELGLPACPHPKTPDTGRLVITLHHGQTGQNWAAVGQEKEVETGPQDESQVNNRLRGMGTLAKVSSTLFTPKGSDSLACRQPEPTHCCFCHSGCRSIREPVSDGGFWPSDKIAIFNQIKRKKKDTNLFSLLFSNAFSGIN